MAATPVTPQVGQATEVVTGGVFVQVFPGGVAGGVITNPITSGNYIYVDPINPAGLTAEGTTFALAPGQSWTAIPGQTTPTSVNCAAGGVNFSAVFWN